jgi:hypothetical protein
VSVSWDDFDGPRHEDEVMAGYRPSPTVAEQDRTHGAGIPAVDRGQDEGPRKYGGAL